MDIFSGIAPNTFALGANKIADIDVKTVLPCEGILTWSL